MLLKVRLIKNDFYPRPGVDREKRGGIFATGTPISNSLGEAWTMMRYLQPKVLEDRGLQHFDALTGRCGLS